MKPRGIRSLAIRGLAMIGIAIVLTTSTLAVATEAGSHINIAVKQEDSSSLACEAAMATPLDLEFLSTREDTELERRQHTAPSAAPSESPSGSPSASIPCSDPFSNPRGSYTSSRAPCVVTFHNENESEQLNPLAAKRHRYHDNYKSSPMYYKGTSGVCETENKIGEAKEYISDWPDECVGDFARCYDLNDPNHRLCQSLRRILEELRNLRRLETDAGSENSNTPWMRELHDTLYPPGTSHISIDCTIDKEALLDSFERQQKLQHSMIEETILAKKKLTVFMITSVLVAVLIVIVAISQLVVQPIVSVIGEVRGRDHGRGSHQLTAAVTPNSGIRFETFDDEVDQELADVPHVIDINAPEHLSSIDEDQTEATPEAIAETLSQQQTILMECDAVPISPQPFHQVSLELDVVPIVPATIIPAHSIQAQVIQDGIAYYM